MDNNETIAKLYSIRAGLSLIAQEKDTLEKELANAEQQKALKIEQARMETEARIVQDRDSVRRAKEQAEDKKRQIRTDTSKQVQKINAEISERQSRISKSQNQAADDAEQSLIDRKPTEPRDKYDSARKTYVRNKKTQNEKLSSSIKDFLALDTTKCVLGMLFCLLHVGIGLYEAWSITTGNVMKWVYWVAILVTIGIMVGVCLAGHDDEWFGLNADVPAVISGMLIGAAYLIYLANIGALLASLVIVGSSWAPEVTPNDPQLQPLMIAISVTTGLAFIVTLWQTIFHCVENDAGWQALKHANKKAKAKRQNRKLEKELEKAKQLDRAWAEYDSLAKQVRDEASAKNVTSGTSFGLQSANSKSREEINDLKFQSDSEIRRLDNDVQRRQAEHEEFKRAAESQCEDKCKLIEKQYADACATLTEIHTKVGGDIWNNLVDNYGKLLDSRDWQILDLVIWQLETGRADTIKEALQLADRETQTERLEMAIDSASKSISTQIHAGFRSLNTELNDNFGKLARGISSTASLLSWKLDEMSHAMDSNSRQIYQSLALNADSIAALSEMQSANLLATAQTMDEIVSQSSLQTALLEKANDSSRDLIRAVDKLRESRKY